VVEERISRRPVNRKIRLSASEKTFFMISYTLLILLSIIVLLPLLNVVAQSLSDPMMVLSGRVVIWPLSPTIKTYVGILKSPSITIGFGNTLIYTVVGTAINIVMTVMCAYPLSRKELWGRGVVMFIFTFTMMFGGGMIPTYLMMKTLGLIDTRWVMVLPGAITVWNMIMARTFFQSTIPGELYESASIDGASDIKVLLSIVLPLSAPIMAVLTLFYAVAHWNSYFNAMMYLSTPRLFNIQLVLRNAITNLRTLMDNEGNLANLTSSMAAGEAAKYAIIVIAMVPVLIIYPFVQKHFVKGIMIGSVKG
jgi:putative aldouronate transport system permease protein